MLVLPVTDKLVNKCNTCFHFYIQYSPFIPIEGLQYDDLLAEESEIVQEALRRLEIADPHAAYDRAYRIRVAQQCSLSHQLLPKDKWVTPSQVNQSIEKS